MYNVFKPVYNGVNNAELTNTSYFALRLFKCSLCKFPFIIHTKPLKNCKSVILAEWESCRNFKASPDNMAGLF